MSPTIVSVAAKREKFGEYWIEDVFSDEAWWKLYWVQFKHKKLASLKYAPAQNYNQDAEMENAFKIAQKKI